MMTLTTIAVGGFASNTGKTSLMCELLRALDPGGWEAIKVTRGHYRSCGKDPHTCCVSHLLGAEPVIRSGRAATYAPGKDTGRYWDAGAANVHWAIVTDRQVEAGIKQALGRVATGKVIIEGTSFTEFIKTDFLILTTRATGGKMKPSARRALARAGAIYLFDEGAGPIQAREQFAAWYRQRAPADAGLLERIPAYTPDELSQLIARVRAACGEASAAAA